MSHFLVPLYALPISRIRPISPIRDLLDVVHLNPRPHKNFIAAGDGSNQQREQH